MTQVPNDVEIEWLKQLMIAEQAGATPPEVPGFVADKLSELGFVWSSGLGAVEITDAGRNFVKRLEKED